MISEVPPDDDRVAQELINVSDIQALLCHVIFCHVIITLREFIGFHLFVILACLKR